MAGTINVGLIGCGFMGRAHSNAYRQVGRFFDLALTPRLAAVCSKDAGLEEFARNWGYDSVETEWRRLVERPDIDLVDICVPNVLHHDIAVAAARAHKIIVCEKPLAMNAAEAEEMAEEVERAGVPNMVQFNYRRVPAVTLAKQLIDRGKLGRIFHYRAHYLQDWTISASVPVGGPNNWRLDKSQAGNGVTGDLMAHSLDLAEWLIGKVASVNALTETFIKERRQFDDAQVTRKVEIDDACLSLARFTCGAIGYFEATRYARGRKNYNTFEINGERASLFFDLENAHQLLMYDHGDESATRGWRTVQVWNDEHPYMSHYWVPGCAIGYEHTHIHAIADFFTGIAEGSKLCPDFRDGLRTQRVCDAILRSAESHQWETV